MVEFIEATGLAALLRGPDAATALVIDVRDEDFEGGHVRGAVNILSDRFYEETSLDAIIEQCLTANVTKVVVHCMFSQQALDHPVHDVKAGVQHCFWMQRQTQTAFAGNLIRELTHLLRGGKILCTSIWKDSNFANTGAGIALSPESRDRLCAHDICAHEWGHA
eukprot:364262-Chlamydomonas_euryale.AAC.19